MSPVNVSTVKQPAVRPAGSRRTAFAARANAVLAATVLLAAALVAGVAGAPQAAAAACGSAHKQGVTVVVDFTKFHHGIKVGCDPSRPANGLVALTKAGFSYTFVPRQPGFICRINSEPRKCNGAPASAYWSYWHAKPHGKWMYSTLGAASYHPKSGWVEGWAFGNGKPPGISPP
jgi:hypothetical protein